MTGRTMWTWMAVLALAAPLSGCGLHGKPTVERKAAPAAGGAAPPRAAGAGAPAQAAPAAAVEPGMVVAPGIVESWGGDTQLSAQESGWIAQVVAKEGEAVRAGQLLATLDDSAQRRSVELARADLAEAEAALARVERGATAEELRQAQADRAAVAARAELARSQAARTARLGEGGFVAAAETERASAEARAEAALAERAEARLQELRRGARAEDRDAARARAAAARARLRLAEANLAIKSPTARQDVRVREVFVEIPAAVGLIPGQRVWGHVSRPAVARETSRRQPSAG